MARQVRISAIKILLFISLLFLGGFLDVLGRPFQLKTLTTIYYLVLAVMFLGRLLDRIVDVRVRCFLTASAWMVVLLFMLRGLKYHAFREIELIERLLWYLYYVPNLTLPAFSLLAALAVDEGRGREKRSPQAADRKVEGDDFQAADRNVEGGDFQAATRKVESGDFHITKGEERKGAPWRTSSCGRWLLHGITLALILLVLTNDLHQAVFRFRPGYVGWDSDYDYGPGYFVVAAWIVSLFLAAVAVMVRKSRLSASKRYFWIPLIPIALGWIYMILYFLDLEPKWEGINLVEFPETACFVVACFWECCISIGLIPSNKGYEELFSRSAIAAQIADADTGIVYASDTARELTTAQKLARQDIMLDGGTRLHRADIQGGYVYWQSDVSEVERLNGELEQLEERLSEETELVRLQNEMQKERAELEEKNKVYDRIAAHVLGQSQEIARLAQEAEQGLNVWNSDATWEGMGDCDNGQKSARYEVIMARICFLGTYVKRYANLMLLAENHAFLACKELELAFDESLRALSACGVSVALGGNWEGEMATEGMLAIYEKWEALIEEAGTELKGVSVSLVNQVCKVVLEGTREEFSDAWPEARDAKDAWRKNQAGQEVAGRGSWQEEESRNVSCRVEREDGICYVRLEALCGVQ